MSIQAKEGRKRQPATISQFSIDELLKHDDKRSKSEANDSKATPFDEVEPGAEESEPAGSTTSTSIAVKVEPKSPSTASCLALALAAGGSRQHETLRTTSPRYCLLEIYLPRVFFVSFQLPVADMINPLIPQQQPGGGRYEQVSPPDPHSDSRLQLS